MKAEIVIPPGYRRIRTGAWPIPGDLILEVTCYLCGCPPRHAPRWGRIVLVNRRVELHEVVIRKVKPDKK